MQLRDPILKQYRKIWLTESSYRYLREQKKLQSKSMSQILDDIIKQDKLN